MELPLPNMEIQRDRHKRQFFIWFYRFGGGPRSSFYIACEPAHLEENWRNIEEKRATGGGGKMISFFRAYEPE